VCTQKQLVTSARQKYWGKFVDIPDLRFGPPRLAFGTPRGSRDPRLRTNELEWCSQSGPWANVPCLQARMCLAIRSRYVKIRKSVLEILTMTPQKIDADNHHFVISSQENY